MRIDHLLVEAKYKAMILPFGDYKNINILESPIGEICETLDDPPRYVRIVAKTVITITSDIANTLAIMLYDTPMKKVYNTLKAHWKYDIHDNVAMFIVYEEVDENEMVIRQKEKEKEKEENEGEEENGV